MKIQITKDHLEAAMASGRWSSETCLLQQAVREQTGRGLYHNFQNQFLIEGRAFELMGLFDKHFGGNHSDKEKTREIFKDLLPAEVEIVEIGVTVR